MVDFTELEAGLAIDQNALDEALQQQPDLFYQVAKELALTISLKDAAKKNLTETEAKIELSIREVMLARDFKITDRAVEARVNTSKEVKEAREEYLELNAKVGKLAALKESYQQRSYVFNNLVDLYITGYWGDAQHRSSTRASMKEDSAQVARVEMNKLRRERLK